MLLIWIKKFLGKRQSSAFSGDQAAQLEERVLRAQEGDQHERNQLIVDYQPYIAKVASQLCKRYIDPETDDEFSVALSAFDEAVNQYSPRAGRNFLGFAETVIRRRLIDYIRREKRHSGHVPYSFFEVRDGEENVINPVEIHQAMEEYEKSRVIEERRAEIIDFSNHLAHFGVTFHDLVQISPKHADTRETMFHIGKRLAEQERLMNMLLEKKMLPIKELLELVPVSRKTVERNRKYIIAVALIYHGNYPCLQEFLDSAGNEKERSAADEQGDRSGKKR